MAQSNYVPHLMRNGFRVKLHVGRAGGIEVLNEGHDFSPSILIETVDSTDRAAQE